MKKPLLTLLIIPLLVSTVQSKTLRIGLSAELTDIDKKSPIFDAEFFMREGEESEIFTGPYTVLLNFKENVPGQYDFKAELYGLAPGYDIFEYDFSLKPRENMLIPALPVKEGSSAGIFITLLDDTSQVSAAKFPQGDTSLWGVSESIHYITHWVKGSLIDFKWRKVIAHLEFIYDKYRKSYRLSEFEKINTYIHPEPTDEVYMDDENFYSIKPRSRRIDLVYGHDIKATTPAPGCELLVYRLWGYGPRWMVTGLAGYYDDNMLRIRDFIKDYGKPEILGILKDEKRVKNNTGSIIAGALVFWLLQNESFAEFKNLYTQSTVLDFDIKFEDVYKYPFDEMLERFIDYVRNYSPTRGELDYYASHFFGRGDMVKARKYYEELSAIDDGDRAASLEKLATCYFWLGNYAAADSVYDQLLELGEESPEILFMKGEIKLTEGKVNKALAFYDESYEKGFITGRLRIISILKDKGQIDSAASLLDNIDEDAGRLVDYSIETAAMKIIRGQSADSLLDMVIRNSITVTNRTPDDPRPYLVLGKAYALMNDYEKATYYMNTAYFLEDSPFNQAFILLEMGKIEDLLGDRERARDFYRQVVELDGEYQKTLAERYLDSPYQRKP